AVPNRTGQQQPEECCRTARHRHKGSTGDQKRSPAPFWNRLCSFR
ncbi:ricin-type beta-trefoil lectin domain protein, partial [Streptomyces ipomoeae 91-03]